MATATAPTFSELSAGTAPITLHWNKTTDSTYSIDCWATEPFTIASVMGYPGNDCLADYVFYCEQDSDGDLVSLNLEITYHGKDGRVFKTSWALAEWPRMDVGRLICVVDDYMRYAMSKIVEDHGSLIALPNVQALD